MSEEDKAVQQEEKPVAANPAITDDQRPVCAYFFGRMLHPDDWRAMTFDKPEPEAPFVTVRIPKEIFENFQNTAREYPSLLTARESLVDLKMSLSPMVPYIMEKTNYDPAKRINWGKVGELFVEALELHKRMGPPNLVIPEGLVSV